MSLKDLDNEEMLTVTAPWVDPEHKAHKTLMARPLTKALVSEVEEAHLGVNAMVLEVETEESVIQKQQKGLDFRHDNLVRAIHYRCIAEESEADTPEQAAPFREVRELFTPEGLAIVNKSYSHESGHAKNVALQLEPKHRILLQSMETTKGTLLDTANEYLDVSRKLGYLDHARLQISEAPSRRGDNLRARNNWIRVVTMVGLAIEMKGANDPALLALWQAVERAKERARLRREREQAGLEGEPQDDGQGGDDGDGDGDGLDLSGGQDEPASGQDAPASEAPSPEPVIEPGPGTGPGASPDDR